MPGTNTASPNDPGFWQQYALKDTQQILPGTSDRILPGMDLNVPVAWSKGLNGEGVTVAVIDSGVNITHPDIQPNIWVNPYEYPGNGINDDGYLNCTDDINGWNFRDNTSNVMDDTSHGTGVAGIIGAVGNNNRDMTGVAPRSKIMPLKFWDMANVVDCVKYASTNGARVVNMSINAPDNATYDYTKLLKQTMQLCPNMLFVAAAGSDTYDFSNASNCYQNFRLPNEIVVAAADCVHGCLTSNSNYGANVDIAAPGGDEYTLNSAGGTTYSSATSFATPYVAGIAALMFQRYPAWSGAQVKDRMMSTYKYIPNLMRAWNGTSYVSRPILRSGFPDAGEATK